MIALEFTKPRHGTSDYSTTLIDFQPQVDYRNNSKSGNFHNRKSRQVGLVGQIPLQASP